MLLFVSALSLGACSVSSGSVASVRSLADEQSVTVEKDVPHVETKVMVAPPFPRSKKSPAPAQDVEAYTQWLYSCRASFQTEAVHSDDTDGGATVGLKIKAVTIKLALPITVYLPPKAAEPLKEHEDGHVQICSLAYGLADQAALEAGRSVIGKTYEGMGKNLEEAKIMALSQPEKVIAASYQEAVADICNQASEKYDDYCQRYSTDLSKSRMELAQSAYQNIVDIPIKVIK